MGPGDPCLVEQASAKAEHEAPLARGEGYSLQLAGIPLIVVRNAPQARRKVYQRSYSRQVLWGKKHSHFRFQCKLEIERKGVRLRPRFRSEGIDASGQREGSG